MATTLEIRTLYDTHIRRRTNELDAVCDATTTVTRCRWDRQGFGIVSYVDADASNIDAVIEEQIAYFDKYDIDFEWKYHDYDAPTNLPERLIAHGFVPETPEAVMVLEIAEAPANLLAPITHDIRKITTLDEVNDADYIASTVWGGDADRVTQRVKPMWELDPSSISLYVAYMDNQPVAYGRLELPQGDNPFAGIWAGATLPAFRRRGIYSELVAIRLQEALARGYTYLQIDADPSTSMPIVRKYGFRSIAFATPYQWSCNDEG